MSTVEPGTTRISVSEEKLRAILAEFKLELAEEFAKKASSKSFEKLEHRVHALELDKVAREAIATDRKDVSDRHLAWLAILAALIGSFVGAVGTLVFQHFFH